MNIDNIARILEALLMVSDAPLTQDKLHQLVEDDGVTPAMIKEALDELQNFYQDRGIELVKVASGYRFQASAAYQHWFHRLLEEKPQRYSKALLETLAIIAYRQPVTRADVEAVRGVAVSSGIMKTLVEREWIRVVGHRDVPGKPSIYATTKAFLDYFGLCALSELPPLTDIKDISELMQQVDEAASEAEIELKAQKVELPETDENDQKELSDIDPLEHVTAQTVETQPKDAESPITSQDEAAEKANS